MLPQRGGERGAIADRIPFRQIRPPAGRDTAYRKLRIDALERRGIGRAKPFILDQARDDLYLLDIVPRCQRHRRTQNVCDMSTGVFGQSEFDRRPLQATAQRYRQDIQRAIPLTDQKPMISSRRERSLSA